MSTTIYKFTLKDARAQTIQMQRGGRILCAQPQDGMIRLWAEVDHTAPFEDRVIEVFGTGHDMPSAERTYIGTVQLFSLMWHVYELHRFHP